MSENNENIINRYFDHLRTQNHIIQSVLDHVTTSEQHLFTLMQNNQSNVRPVYSRPSGRRRTPNNNYFESLINNLSSQLPLPSTFMDPVVVAPSANQINHACLECTYGQIENPMNSTCPICMEPFTESSRVLQIKHCGHIFNYDELMRSFQTSVRCPMCRYDIRRYRRNNLEVNEGVDSNNNWVQQISSQLVNDISNNLLADNASVNHLEIQDPSSNLNMLYSFYFSTPFPNDNSANI